MSPRFLVVDDALTDARSTSLLLEAEGVTREDIREAYTATEALGLIEDHPPDVVVLDVGLPDMGGDALCPRLRATDPDVRIVVLTALEDGDPRLRRVVAAGADHVIRKPMARDHAQALVDLARGGARRRGAPGAPGRRSGTGPPGTRRTGEGPNP